LKETKDRGTGDIQAAVDNAEKAAKAIVIQRLDSYVQRTEAIAA